MSRSPLLVHLTAAGILTATFGCPGLFVPELNAQSRRVPAAISGSTRVLLVFARFKDDRQDGSGCRAGRGWPLTEQGIEPLPEYSRTLLSPHDRPPFADSSATAYFYEQSDESLVLFGDAYPQVVVSKHPASYYHSSAGRGYGYLAAEILQKIDPDVDFTRYDNNPHDGIVDHVFIILRRDEAGTFTGVADLSGADRVRGRPRDEIVIDGVKVDWTSSGSFIYNERPGHIVSQSYMVRMIAHEYGHHIWNPRDIFRGHVRAIRGNDIPVNDDNAIGYILMAGRGGGDDARGDLIISAPERDAIGWLKPRILRPHRDSLQVVRLEDLYSTGDAVRIDVVNRGGGDRVSFYLTNRQRIGWFDQYRLDAPEGCTAYEMGFLRTTGLLAMLTEWRDGRFVLDVLPSDGTMELSVENSTYAGDLYGPRGAGQITPFTRPSTSMPDGTPSWFAVDEIGMTGSADSAMQFVFVPDFRRRAIVREDSRITAGLGRVVIRGDLRVTASSKVVIESGAHLDVRGEIVMDPGARTTARSGARVDVDGVAHYVFVDTELQGL